AADDADDDAEDAEDADDDAEEASGVIDAANRTIVLSPGVDWNSPDAAMAQQLEVRLTEPAVAGPDVGYAISIENISTVDLVEPVVVQIAVPRTDGLELPTGTDWICDALSGTVLRCNHPGGLEASSTSLLEFEALQTVGAQPESGDEQAALAGSEPVLRSEGGSPVADTALALGALALTGFVIFGARRLVSGRR
ncbi:MAG: hypothetical protein AAF480_08095, partial [Actinomycetota bacterium]